MAQQKNYKADRDIESGGLDLMVTPYFFIF